MVKSLGKFVIIGALSMCLVVAAGYADAAKKQIAIAILPCTDVLKTFKKFHRLVTYLRKETGFDIRLIVPKNFSEFERTVKNADIDFALQDPYTYVMLENLFNKAALIRTLTREGATSQSGAVIVRKDSGIKKLEHLIGKTVMFGPRLSAAKWIAAKKLFEENGIDIDNDLRAYSNGGCCEDIAFSVYLKAIDAGVVCDHYVAHNPEKQEELGMEVEKIIAISRTKSIPTRVFAARKGISTDIVMKINQALLRLGKNRPEHSEILDCAELGGFQESRDKYYDSIRQLMGEKL